MNKLIQQSIIIAISCLLLAGCIGSIVGAAVDTAIEVIKVPFKVGGAVIDVVTPDELTDDGQKSGKQKAIKKDQQSYEVQALELESEGL